MIKRIKDFFSTSLEQKLTLIEMKKELLLEDIRKGKLEFSDNEMVIEFSNLLTAKLIKSYQEQQMLSVFEEKVLNKVLKDNFYRVSFLLLSQVDGLYNIEDIREVLASQGFVFLEDVGFINIDKIVTYVDLADWSFLNN